MRVKGRDDQVFVGDLIACLCDQLQDFPYKVYLFVLKFLLILLAYGLRLCGLPSLGLTILGNGALRLPILAQILGLQDVLLLVLLLVYLLILGLLIC